MTGSRGPIVLKIGGSVLLGDSGWAPAVSCIRRAREGGRGVLVVVSATNGTTERLLSEARSLCDRPPEHLLAGLLRCGEDTSVAMLAIALAEAGIRSEAADAAWLNLLVDGPRLEARPVGVDVGRLRRALGAAGVLIVPGFVGRHVDGGPALLGRGGSDLTAVFLAARLGATCRLVKDVDGLYESDPRDPDARPRRYRHARWQTVIDRGAELVQARAVEAAREYEVDLEVTGLGGIGTTVGPRAGRPGPGAT